MNNETNVKIELNQELQEVLKAHNVYTFSVYYESLDSEILKEILNFEPTDYGNALAMEKLFPNRFVKNSSYGLMTYNGKHWTRENADDLCKIAALETLKVRQRVCDGKKEFAELRKRTVLNSANIHNLSRLFTELLVSYVEVSQFNAVSHLLNVDNGVVDLRTGQLLEHDYAYYFTCCSKVKRVSGKVSLRFQLFLEQTMLDWNKDENRIYVQKLLGYCLTGETNLEKIFYHYGAMGRNGKGTLAHVMKALLSDLGGSAQFSTFTKRRDGNDQGFDLAPLHDKRIIVASESSDKEAFNEAMMKNASGNDSITAAFKGKDQFTFLPRWKINLFTNHKPKGDSTDNAFWTRFAPILYPNCFEGKEDTNLKPELTNEENLQGILNWFVEGAIMFYADGKNIAIPQQFRDILASYRAENDTVQKWLDAKTVNMKQQFGDLDDYTQGAIVAPLEKVGITWELLLYTCLNGHYTRTSYDELYKNYSEFCVAASEAYPLGKSKFLDSLRSKGFIDKQRAKLDGKVQRCFEGIYVYQGEGDYVDTLNILLKSIEFDKTVNDLQKANV